MNKTTRELLIVLGLLGVLLALLLPQRWPSGPSGVLDAGGVRPRALPPPLVGLPPPSPIPPAAAAVRPHYTAEAQARRDPMVSLLPDQTQEAEAATAGHARGDGVAWRGDRQPALTPEAVGKALSVEGMVWGASRAQALINGKLYEVGDVVEGARIVSIEREGVTVERDGVRALVTPPPVSVSTENQRAMGPGARWYGQGR